MSGSLTNNRADNITVHLDGTSSNNIITLNQDIAISGSLVTENSTAGEFNEYHLNLGAGASYAYEPTGDWIIQEMNQRPMVEGSAYAAGVGNVTLAGHMMYSRSKEITDSLSKRSRSAHTQPPPSGDDSSRS